MKWAVRSIIWMTILAFPCWFISGYYQRVLAEVISTVMTIGGKRVSVYHLQIYAPIDLGMFLGMCLASSQAPLRVRTRSILLGVPVLFLVEIVTVIIATIPALFSSTHGIGQEFSSRWMGHAIETVVWVSAPSLWLLLLGRWELKLGIEPAKARLRRG